MSTVIARIWHGVTPEALADEYQAYLYATGIPGYQSTPGNLGVLLLRRSEQGKTHFLLTSFWESYDAIAAFAGVAIEKAKYYPQDEKFLLELEPYVIHYEVVAGSGVITLPEK